MSLWPLALFAAVCAGLLLGYPVFFTLAGISLWFAVAGTIAGTFDPALLLALPDRWFGTLTNTTLMAIPLFVLMGVVLERAQLAQALLDTMGRALGRLPAGLCLAVIAVGTLLAASTGIVGATVVTMGLMSLPTMLQRGYHPGFASGAICATGTLGQIIPPSIALVLLGDVISSAWQRSQLDLGVFNAQPVSVGDLFVGALIPGLLLVALYGAYALWVGLRRPDWAPRNTDAHPPSLTELLTAVAPPLLLMVLVLGSIMMGIATPTEAAAVGAAAALGLAWQRGALSLGMLRTATGETLKITGMVFGILLGASLFGLVFRGLGGELLIEHMFEHLPGGKAGALLAVMAMIFVLGFILDFIEITFIVVPLLGPALLAQGVDPVWLGILIALNLQTSFLTPPFGFALFYLRGAAPPSLRTSDLYRGVIPFVVIQLMVLLAVALIPELATWLPGRAD